MSIVNGRGHATFDVERATRKFYARFKDEYAAFLACIEGMTEQNERVWYASLLLNRLLFVFFLQKKGFFDTQGTGLLNGDRAYLTHRLQVIQQERGVGYFHLFLQHFFHNGPSSRQKSPELAQLFGNVPYFPDSLFSISMLEDRYHAIHIPDHAFEQLFRFFEDFEWLLDDRSLLNDYTINQDVIGSIFEKSMGKKQSGVYYTQQDVTEYIGKNSLIPRLLDLVAHQCPDHFGSAGSIWRLLRTQPERYIYESLQQGCALPLPPEIEVGVSDSTQRVLWDEPALPAWALPGEIWREVVVRRQRFARLKADLTRGELCSIDELITANLDLHRFVQDIIRFTEHIDLLAAFYTSLTKLTVLDPTCGSGAFLQAALTILEPLYEVCLERMRLLVEARERNMTKQETSILQNFHEILRQVARFTNQRYFIYTAIITRNLYGVDTMREATELCKLRLFLKAASQVETCAEMHALFAIDFNIWTGNALVGFATYREMDSAGDLVPGNVLITRDVLQKMRAREPDQLADTPHLLPEQEFQPALISLSKQRAHAQSGELRDALDRYLAASYGIARQHFSDDEKYEANFTRWRDASQPFHWLLECADVLQNGGFEVIIGNPPYVAYSQVKDTYQVQWYETQSCGNLCAYVVERALKLLRPRGRCGMIVPVSTISSKNYRPLSRLLLTKHVWISSYSNRPGKLFAAAEQRLAIILLHNDTSQTLLTTAYRHWYEAERAHLFATLCYATASIWPPTGMPLKSGSALAEAIFARMAQRQGFPLLNSRQPEAAVWVHNGPTYWVRALPFEPNVGQKSQHSNHYRKIPVDSEETAFVLAAILSSSTFYFFYKLMSNCRDLGLKELRLFPLGELSSALFSQLLHAGQLLAQRLETTARHSTRHYRNREGMIYAVTYEEYRPARARDLLNEIDRILATHYGFSDEELDLLLHDNLKYRLSL